MQGRFRTVHRQNSKEGDGEVMQILPCASCGKIFVLPDGTSTAATIECPNCEQQYVVDSLVHDELMHWKVVYDPDAEGDSDEASILVVDAEPVGDPTGVVVADGLANAAETLRNGASSPRSTTALRRARRKSGLPIWSVVQVVLGGVAAVPIALLILWWVLDRDVLDAGETVARYVPWIVPERYHPYDAETPAESRSVGRQPLRRGTSRFRRFDDVLPIDTVGEKTPEAASSPQPAASVPRDRADEPEAPSGTERQEPPAVEKIATLPVEADRSVFALARRALKDLEAFQRLSQSTPRLESQEPASGEEREASEGGRRQLAQQAYTALMDLSRAVAGLPVDSPVRRPAEELLAEVADRIGHSPELRDLVQQGALFWGRQPPDSRPAALALIGKVVAVEAAGQADRVLVRLDSARLPPGTEHLWVADRPRLSIDPGEEVFVLAGAVSSGDGGQADIGEKTAGEAPDQEGFEAYYLRVIQP